ncbi:MAG TPA: CopK family periplasmic copper-binding protein [Pseudomonadales bacterium]|jgi:hypothetical protein|nr:CopK family periplasmic copper-binding protein [Pseudomonadales bacterium]
MKTMKNALIAIAFICSLGGVAVVLADELPAEKIELKDGSTLYLHPDGTSRMVDPHGKKIEMRDGEEMQLADGRTIMMKNKKVWITFGPPGKGGAIQKND